MKHKPFAAMKKRRCMSLHHCELCGHKITWGQFYRDGGYNHRAHDSCAKAFYAVYEDDLPGDITDTEYDAWYLQSCVIDGVRMGPKLTRHL